MQSLLVLIRRIYLKLFNEEQRDLLYRKRKAVHWFSCRGGFLEVWGAILAWLARPLPLKTRVAFKESTEVVSLLDWKKGKIRMSVESREEFLRLQSCIKEPETVDWLQEMIRQGDVFYDIGANVGAYSLVAFFAAAGQAQVYAFEPSFSTYAQLCKNIFLNAAQGKIVPICTALSRYTQLVDFGYSDVRAGAARHGMGAELSRVDLSLRPVFTQPVLAYRLDELVEQFGFEPPHLIKIDVDGYELDVLEGAVKTLAAPTLRSVLIEIDLSKPEIAQAEVEFLEGHGFHLLSRHQHGDAELYNYIYARDR